MSVLTILLVLGCERPVKVPEAPSKPVELTELKPGLWHAEHKILGRHSRALVVAQVLKFNPVFWRQRIVTAKDMESAASDAADFRVWHLLAFCWLIS